MRIRELIENTGEWISHRQLAEIIYMRTGNKQLARDFDAIEDEFVSQDDAQSTGLSGFDVDALEFDRERVNKILGDNKTGIKVLKMKQDEQYNTKYQLLQSARLDASVIDFDKATDPANTPIDKVNKLLQRIGITDYGVIINKPFDAKTYELLIDTYMNKVFTGAMENKILDYVIKIYQKRGEKAKQLPPTTEGTRCWKGYKKKGMKTMFGKRVPNCVKNEETDIDSLPDLIKDINQDLPNIQSVSSKEIPDIVPFNNQALTNKMQKDFPDATPGIKKNCQIISSMVAKKYGLQNPKPIIVVHEKRSGIGMCYHNYKGVGEYPPKGRGTVTIKWKENLIDRVSYDYFDEKGNPAETDVTGSMRDKNIHTLTNSGPGPEGYMIGGRRHGGSLPNESL